MKIKIIGDRGFIGSALKKQLRKEKHKIVNLVEDADCVYFVANSTKDIYNTFDILSSLLLCLDHIYHHNIHLIYLSSAKVNTLLETMSLNDSYATMKYMCEQMIVSYAQQPGAMFAYTIVRLNNVYGKKQRNPNVIGDRIRELKKKPMSIVILNAFFRTSFLYIDDCVDALIQLAKEKNRNRVITLGHTNDYTIHHVVSKIVEIMKVNTIMLWSSGSGRGRISDNQFFDWKPKVGLIEGIKKML